MVYKNVPYALRWLQKCQLKNPISPVIYRNLSTLQEKKNLKTSQKNENFWFSKFTKGAYYGMKEIFAFEM